MLKNLFRISRSNIHSRRILASNPFLMALLAMLAIAVVPAAAADERYRVKRIPDTWNIAASEDSVYFDLGSSSIDEAAFAVLRRHVAKLRTIPSLKVLLVAHTDDLGSASIELAKGQERLDAVRRILEESKVAPGRIRTENHGSESRSEQACADEECRRQNRRVDIQFQP